VFFPAKVRGFSGNRKNNEEMVSIIFPVPGYPDPGNHDPAFGFRNRGSGKKPILPVIRFQ
jgi:hypothetical protein